MSFLDRRDAARHLARRLGLVELDAPVVLGVPRGGIEVAATVAAALAVPFDVVAVRGFDVPFQPDRHLGAVGPGTVALDERLARRAGVRERELRALIEENRRALLRSDGRHRSVHEPECLRGRTALVVDDGAVSGTTARVACREARARGAARVVVALPVCPLGVDVELRGEADQVVALDRPPEYGVLGASHHEFEPLGDDDVARALRHVDPGISGTVPDMEPVVHVSIPSGCSWVSGRLAVPAVVRGLVVLARAGSVGRYAAGSRRLTRLWRARGFATAAVDLLTPAEELRRDAVRDVALLRRRLDDILDGVLARPVCAGLPVGLVGTDTVADAARAVARGRTDVVAIACGAGLRDDPVVIDRAAQLVGDRVERLIAARGPHSVEAPV